MKRQILAVVIMTLLVGGALALADTVSKWTTTAGIGKNMVFRDNTFSLTDNRSIWETAPQLAGADPMVSTVFMEDFVSRWDSLFVWKQVGDVGGTHAIVDTLNGAFVMVPHVTDNDEIYLYQDGKPYYLTTSKPIWAEIRFMPVNPAGTDSTYSTNYIFGLVSTAVQTADLLVDDGGGPPANYTGACWFKVDSGHVAAAGGVTTWQCETSATTTQNTTTAAGTFADDTWVRLGIFYDGAGKTKFYQDGVLKATKATTGLPTAVNLGVAFGLKHGGSQIRTALYVDYIKVYQIR